jgi:hypothetical protein
MVEFWLASLECTTLGCSYRTQDAPGALNPDPSFGRPSLSLHESQESHQLVNAALPRT